MVAQSTRWAFGKKHDHATMGNADLCYHMLLKNVNSMQVDGNNCVVESASYQTCIGKMRSAR
eukprot:5091755-Amphidinium_carterae.1